MQSKITSTPAADVPTEFAAIACLEAWLRCSDDAQQRHYLALHHEVLTTPTTQTILRRWIAAAPPDLAGVWSARLVLLHS